MFLCLYSVLEECGEVTQRQRAVTFAYLAGYNANLMFISCWRIMTCAHLNKPMKIKERDKSFSNLNGITKVFIIKRLQRSNVKDFLWSRV